MSIVQPNVVVVEHGERRAAESGRQDGVTQVLIAGADRVLLHAYREALAQEGLSIRTATNGLDCVSQIRLQVPDVLVLESDMLWGGIDGVLARMIEEPEMPRVPVLILVNGSMPAEPVLARLPMVAYCAKPVTPAALVRRFDAWRPTVATAG